MSKRNKEYIFIGAIVVILGGILLLTRINLNNNIENIDTIQIRVKDDVIKEVSFEEDGIYEIEVKLGHLFVEVKDGQYRVFDVDCPDKICESVGWLKKGSDKLIVCLPNDIVVVQS